MTSTSTISSVKETINISPTVDEQDLNKPLDKCRYFADNCGYVVRKSCVSYPHKKNRRALCRTAML